MSAGSGGARAHHEHPSRPFRAGFIAGHDSTLWLLDVSRPILARRARDGTCSLHPIPGAIRRSGIVGWTPTRLHPDESGCWVAGVDGVAHCDHEGTIGAVDPDPVRLSALSRGVLSTVPPNGALSVTLRNASGDRTDVELPAEVVSVCAVDDGFVVLVRTGAQGSPILPRDRGLWCARIGFDGRVSLGEPWPRVYWCADDLHLVDVGMPAAIRGGPGSCVLGNDLRPALTIPYGTDYEPWPTRQGPWFAMAPGGLARVTGDAAFRSVDDRHRVWNTYFRLDPHLTRPRVWAVAPGFARSVAVLDEPGQLWISTFEGLFASAAGALDRPGEVAVAEADPLPLPDLPTVPESGIGDPEVYAYRECRRLLAENEDQGMLDARPFGHFPHTEIIVLFALRRLPEALCATRFRLFDRDGRPALWRGAPTIMEHIELGIRESGGIERVRRIEPGWNGWVWV